MGRWMGGGVCGVPSEDEIAVECEGAELRVCEWWWRREGGELRV
jgi:hypothetical protein